MTSGQTINGKRLSVTTGGHGSAAFQRGSKKGSCWSRLECRDCVSHAGGFPPKCWFQQSTLRWGEEEEQSTKLETIPNQFLLLKK